MRDEGVIYVAEKMYTGLPGCIHSP